MEVLQKGSRKARSPVGLATVHPHRHCPTVWSTTSGCVRSKRIHGVFPTLAASFCIFCFLKDKNGRMLTEVLGSRHQRPSDRDQSLHEEKRALL